jgi:hypothetical protein
MARFKRWLTVYGKLGTHASAVFFVRSADGGSIDDAAIERGCRVQIRSTGDPRVAKWTPALVSMVKNIGDSPFYYFEFL